MIVVDPFRAYLRGSSEALRSYSHVADCVVESIEFHQTIRKVFSISNIHVRRRISTDTGHRRRHSFQREISQIMEEVRLRPSLVGPVLHSERQKQGKHLTRPSNRSSRSPSSFQKDLVCLAKFENVELFFGLDWKKKFKSPSEFCFALKVTCIAQVSPQHVLSVLASLDTEEELEVYQIHVRRDKERIRPLDDEYSNRESMFFLSRECECHVLRVDSSRNS